MPKNNDQDFAKTVVIPPEENQAFRQRTMATKRVTKEEALGGTVKGPPKGLSGWSVFFLLVIAVLVGVGFVLMYWQ